ncbi:LPS O-antigen chain length determinant protein WzzB [Escherichia coli]|uniref:LPS O-antigen chain length determinant protein WzzB n=1 Tax=Escherichia coli TaxID=562 RepID=UPI003EDF28D2
MLTEQQRRELDWEKTDGLMPVIVQHAVSGEVLMLGYMNPQALDKTIESGKVTFFSRTKQRLWTKGETSGNFLNVVNITPDCDNDTLLLLANPIGPTCHKGTSSCFGDTAHQWLFLYQLEQLLAERKSADPETSYTAKLYASGTKRIAQKVGEEGVETALAATVHDRFELTNEASDLMYHLLVLLWRGKMTIIISVIVAIALAIGYLAVAKEKWTSTAIITQPDVGQIAGYNNAMNVIYGQAAPKVPDLQEALIGRFSSAFSALAETLDNQKEPEKLTIEPSVKNQQLPLTVSYVGQTAEDAQMKLAQYIQQVDDKVNQELEKDLKDNLALGRKNLQDSLRTQEVVAQEQKDLRIRQIQEALQYANQAQVTKPQIQQTGEDITQDTLFLLGSEALESMIKHEATRPLVFSPNYYQTRQNLLDIENLKVDDLDIHAYRYVMKPTLPIRRDSPKKAITLILAVLLGGMVGAGIVLGRNALRNYNSK